MFVLFLKWGFTGRQYQYIQCILFKKRQKIEICMTGFKKFSKKLCEVLIVDNDKGYMSLRRRCPGAKSIHFVITISLITKELTTENTLSFYITTFVGFSTSLFSRIGLIRKCRKQQSYSSKSPSFLHITRENQKHSYFCMDYV